MSSVAISTAAAGAAAGSAAAASAAAHRAKVERCKLVVEKYDTKMATVQDSRNYADCIQTLYPEPLSAEATLLMKVFIVLIFIGGVFGAAKGWRDEGPIMGVIGLVCGALATALAGGLVALAYIGVMYVLS